MAKHCFKATLRSCWITVIVLELVTGAYEYNTYQRFIDEDGTICALTVTFNGLEIPEGGYVRAISGEINQVYCKANCTGRSRRIDVSFYNHEERISTRTSKRIYNVYRKREQDVILNVNNMIESDMGLYFCKGPMNRMSRLQRHFSLLFACPNGFTLCDKTKCIENKKICDGVVDCQDEKDESDCVTTAATPATTTTTSTSTTPTPITTTPTGCTPDEFQCQDSKCIPKSQICDANPDGLHLWRDVSGFDGESTSRIVESITEGTIKSGVEPKTVSAITRGCEDTFLPQDDPNLERRKETLIEQRKLYEYTQREKGIPCQVKEVPELQTSHYTKAALEAVVGRIDGTKEVFIHDKEWKDLNDVKNIFGGLFPAPSDFTRWDDDVKFGMQRFAGTNNEVIRLCEKIPEKLAVTPAMLTPFLEMDTLQSALSNKRLFVIDHSILDNCKKESRSVVCSPIALFYRRTDDKIVPIAIQLFQDQADDNPVFLPSDSKYTWILAKMWFNNADACVHQSINHLGYTHLVMEGFEVSVHRHLAQSHPMFKLMLPHFAYLMTINELAVGTLLKKGGFIDTVMSIGTEGAIELIRRYRTKWRLNVEGTLPANLKERGVDNPEVVPDYPFRDDALLTYKAILRYVTDYVFLYYPSDTVLSRDIEIQSWRAELDRPIEHGGLGVLGVEGVSGMFTSRDQLIQVVTSIIYTCSAGHAALNFKQYDEYAFTLNYPSKLRGKPPSDKRSLSERDVLQAIQDRSDQYQLLTITKILSEHSFGKSLGNFETNYICEQKALEIVSKFRAELNNIHSKIQERNSKRPIRYDYMDPILIPNSISI